MTKQIVVPPAAPERASARTPDGEARHPTLDYAIGQVRDLFLAALEGDDRGRAIEIARHLVACGNPLPSVTCVALGLPAGSTYGAGARAVLAQAAADA